MVRCSQNTLSYRHKEQCGATLQAYTLMCARHCVSASASRFGTDMIVSSKTNPDESSVPPTFHCNDSMIKYIINAKLAFIK